MSLVGPQEPGREKVFENWQPKPDTGEKNRDVDSIPPALAAHPYSGRKSCRNLKAIRKVLEVKAHKNGQTCVPLSGSPEHAAPFLLKTGGASSVESAVRP